MDGKSLFVAMFSLLQFLFSGVTIQHGQAESRKNDLAG